MKITNQHSHMNAVEWLTIHKKNISEEIEQIISGCDIEQQVSKKMKMKEINERLKNEFIKRGWKRVRYNYITTDNYRLTEEIIPLQIKEQKKRVQSYGKTPGNSFNQIDLIKEGVAVEVRLDNTDNIEFDLFVKHLGFYIKNTIDVGIEIVPTKKMQSQMSSGPGYFERVLHHMARQGRGAPAVPLVLIGVEP